MLAVRFLVAALASLVFPGAGHAALGARRHGAMWCGAGLLALFAMASTLWALPMALAIRVVCVLDLIRAVRAHRDGKLDWVGGVGIVALSAIAICGAFATVFGLYRVPSSSMAPTIVDGDLVITSRLAHAVQRGEVIVFDQPKDHVPYIKRVAARGGETIEIRCTVLYVNGDHDPNDLPNPAKTQRDYPAAPGDGCAPRASYKVPKNTVFVVGDNGQHSFDSRDFGPVPVDAITGRALGIAWPLTHLADL